MAVRKASLIGGKQQWAACLLAQGAHAAPGIRLAPAIRFKLWLLRGLLHGTMSGIGARLLTIQPAHMPKSGGAMQDAAGLKLVFMTVPDASKALPTD